MIIDKKAEALQSLRPNAEWHLPESGLVWMDKEQTQPTDSEIDAEVIRLQAEFDALAYSRARQAEYPDWSDYSHGRRLRVIAWIYRKSSLSLPKRSQASRRSRKRLSGN